MCKCTPSIRTPYCGKPGCEWPEQNSAGQGNPWLSMDTAPREPGAEFLAIIQGLDTGRLRRVVLEAVDEPDADWYFDGDEISNAWLPIAWQPLPPLGEIENGAGVLSAGQWLQKDHVPVPKNVAEAALMYLLGERYLKDHAPGMLKQNTEKKSG